MLPFPGPLRFHGNAILPPLAGGTPVRTPSATDPRLPDAGTALSQAPVAPASGRPPENPFRRRAVHRIADGSSSGDSGLDCGQRETASRGCFPVFHPKPDAVAG